MSILFEVFAYLVPAFIVAFIIEALSEAFWWRHYFNFGIPVFTRTICVTSPTMRIPHADDIEEYGLPDNPNHPSILAREIDVNRYGLTFYKSGRRYISVMHGFIFFDDINRRITIKGFADWPALAFASASLAFLLMAVTDAPDITFAAPPVLFIAVLLNIYDTQRKRFNDIADMLEKLWS